MRNDILERKDEIVEWISEDRPKAWICKQLDCKQETLNAYLKKMLIEYDGNQGSRGKRSNKRKTFSEYLKSPSQTSYRIKLRMLEDGIKLHKCECCGNTKWLDEPIPLELHHKDGDHRNNKLENLELLCPNCHSKCDNNSGKGIRRKILAE